VGAEYLRIADLLGNRSSSNTKSSTCRHTTCWYEAFDLFLELFNTAAETKTIVTVIPNVIITIPHQLKPNCFQLNLQHHLKWVG
jgi:hypothetical protein